jgi:LuxR family quorum sensing-dependent transcriptional regulator
MSRKSLDQTLRYIHRVNRAQTPGEVCAALLETLSEYGFEHVLAGTIPVPGSSKKQQEANVLLHRWPMEWWDRYFSRGYLFVDPAIKQVLSGLNAFLWSELTPLCRDNPDAVRVMNEASDFRLRAGFTVPLYTLDGEVAGFSFAGERIEMPPERRGMLQLIATFALGRTLILEEPPREPLSQRERDVLRWAAEGKSEWEIGAILGVSEHMADKAMRSIRMKLRTTSRTHAVAKAIRLGLID